MQVTLALTVDAPTGDFNGASVSGNSGTAIDLAGGATNQTATINLTWPAGTQPTSTISNLKTYLDASTPALHAASGITLDSARLVGGNVEITYSVANPAADNNTPGAASWKFDDGLGGDITINLNYTKITRTVGIPQNARITGISPTYDFSTWQINNNPDLSETRADDDVTLPLVAGMFKWTTGTGNSAVEEDGNVQPYAGRNVSESQLSRGNITVRSSTTKGAAALDKIAFDGSSNAVIKISFTEYFVSVNSLDYEFSIYLAYKNSRFNDSKFVLAGTIENPTEPIYKDDDYASTEDGTVIKAEEYSNNVEFYGGEGVYATKNAFSGTKYYFVVTQEIDNTDDAVMAQYPEIETVYKVRAVNMSGSGNFIRFKELGDTYYVYNADGEYIGQSNEALPYSTKYYLANSRITMAGGGTTEPEPDDGSGDGSTGTGSTGDGSTGATDPNDNPGTGANGMVNVAIAAGMIALAAAGAVSLKK